MKKRVLIYSMFCALSISVLTLSTSCGNQNHNGTTTQKEAALSVTTEGELVVGKTINLIVKDSKDETIQDVTFKIIEGETLIEITGTSIALKNVGTVKIEASKEGFTTSTFTFTIAEDPIQTMNVELKGYLYHGETIEVIVKDKNNKLVDGIQINLTKGADFAIVKGNKISLLDSGLVEGTISKEGFKDYKLSFESKKVERIKDIKDNIDQFANKMVTVRGVVTASYGNTFYLMDGKNGFYVYNMNTMETAGNPGDGFELGKVVMNTPVLVTALVDNGKYGIQLKGYNGSFIKEACVLKSNMTVQDSVAYEVKNEGDLMSLNASKKLSGSRVKITGKFIGGDFSAAEQTSAKNAIFTFKYGETSYDAKFNKYGSVETVKSYWNKENIEIGDYVTIESNFTHYQDHISIDLCNEGTIIHNESKDPTNIICQSSASEVEIGSSITLSAKLPEGVTGNVTYEIVNGANLVTLNGDKLTGVKAGLVTLIAKVGSKQSMPIEIIVKEKGIPTIKAVRDLVEGTQVETTGKVLAFLRNGVVLQDDTGYLYAIAKENNDFYPHNMKVGDTLKVNGVRYNYNSSKKLPAINNATFEVVASKEVITTYQKVNQVDFKTFTDEELKYGKAVEFTTVVDKVNKSSKTGERTGSGYFVADTSDEPGTEYFFYHWGNENFEVIKPLQSVTIQAIIYHKYTTPIGKTGYSILVTSSKANIIAPQTLSLALESSTIDTHLTFGTARTFANIAVGPEGASKETVELVAIEGAELVKIEKDFFNDYKISSTGKPGTVKLQAQTKDGKVKSDVVTLTINLYVAQ